MDFADPSSLELPQLVRLLRRISPLGFPGTPEAPVYEYHAVADELAPIGPARELVERFCGAGVTVQHYEDYASEHISLVATGAVGAVDYLQNRFEGAPAPSNCPA
jgi:triacylglycerol lipase